MKEGDSLPKLFIEKYKKWGDTKVALRNKTFGVWKAYTWKDCYEKVRLFSLGLVSLGLKPGEKVSIIGDNAAEWYWGEYAIQAAGGVPVGLFPDAAPAETKYIIEHSDSKFVITEDQEQVDKILEQKEELPLVKKLIYWDSKGLESYDDPLLMSWNQIEELGRQYEQSHQGEGRGSLPGSGCAWTAPGNREAAGSLELPHLLWPERVAPFAGGLPLGGSHGGGVGRERARGEARGLYSRHRQGADP